MECSLDSREDSSYRGKQYFPSEILPRKLKVRSFCLCGERTIENKEDVTVLYIRSGRGSVRINDRTFGLEPGTLLILYPFHFRKIQAQEGMPLEGEECILNMGALLFIFAVPPYSRPVAVFEGSPSIYRLESQLRNRMEAMWDRILKENQSEDCYGEKMQFALVMRIMVLCRKYGIIVR